MAKSSLETQIEQAASAFALQIVEAIKGATLQELIALQEGGLTQNGGKRRGKKPGPKQKAGEEETGEKKVDRRKNRVVKNYPKCAYPGCTNNRFPRGKGFCGQHWREWKAGKIKSASTYTKKS